MVSVSKPKTSYWSHICTVPPNAYRANLVTLYPNPLLFIHRYTIAGKHNSKYIIAGKHDSNELACKRKVNKVWMWWVAGKFASIFKAVILTLLADHCQRLWAQLGHQWNLCATQLDIRKPIYSALILDVPTLPVSTLINRLLIILFTLIKKQLWIAV